MRGEEVPLCSSSTIATFSRLVDPMGAVSSANSREG